MELCKKIWSIEEIQNLYQKPLFGLIYQAQEVHSQFHDREEIQLCTVLSIKTGGCSEDCKYCAQSSYYKTAVTAEPMMKLDQVVEIAQSARANGASRICLSMAWREVRENRLFDQVLQMVQSITSMGLEVCCTLGMLDEEQAKKLKSAGLYAYNHNLDSSERFYNTIITTRSYQERLQTLDVVENQKLLVCCGGIIGMGESIQDRLELLHVLSQRDPHPSSVPINQLVPIKGTPLENQPKVSIWEMLHLIATTRIVLPRSIIRLSGGRLEMSLEQQALCFLAGANSIHSGDRLLTTATLSFQKDNEMLKLFGLKPAASFRQGRFQ